MSSAVSGAAGLTSKEATNHANTDRDETIYFKDIPTDLRDWYALKRHQVDNFRKSDLEQYHNKLTVDKHNAMQHWNMVEYPNFGAENTTVHNGQTYLCIINGSIYDHLV